MKVSSLGVLSGIAAIAAVCLGIGIMDGCGNQPTPFDSDSGNPGASSSGSGSGSGSSSGLGMANPDGGGGPGFVMPEASAGSDSAGSSSSSGGVLPVPIGKVTAPDCTGCKFPELNPPPPTCAGAPAIKLVYPTDGVLLPPNMNVISVQWTPYGAPFTRFEVDFEQSPNTDWRVITACSNQTTDMQAGGTPSGGCELTVEPSTWGRLVQQDRGGGPVAITVRGTTNGTCASVSSNTVNVSWAEEDLLGTYYYWQSQVSSAGVGGQIFMKVFGDLGMKEQDVTSNVTAGSQTLMATCNGCHALARDGSRMVVYSDDNDSDDEYTDISGSLLDMTPLPGMPAAQLGVGANPNRFAQGGQPPGFSTLHPNATSYVSSNGMPLLDAGTPPFGISAGTSTSSGYPTAVPANAWSLWDGKGNFTGPVTIGPANTRPTMPDWSIDGKTIVYVQPASVASWTQDFGGTETDDDHIFGGSLYTVPYNGNGMFGTPTVFLMSGGENNYYPSYSPDADPQNMKPPSYVLFNRVADQGGGTACNNGFCPNDSFSNPAARLWLMKNMAGATPIDLEKANGSPAANDAKLSNSYPRWAPFVQTYKGNPILWFTFSSTRDYGLRVLNHKQGMYQCYPADAPETQGVGHSQTFAAACQQPQLWMAPIFFTEAQGNKDPSGFAFWIPYQDIQQHNHTAQWTWTPNPPPPVVDAGPPPMCMCANLYEPCGAANACGCCAGKQLVCSGNSKCITIPN
jgi:hypothetical protein